MNWLPAPARGRRLLDLPCPADPSLTSRSMSSGVLEIKGLTRRIRSNTVFTDVSFTLSPGQILFVMGPSGAGKSLLLRSIAYLDTFQGGGLSLSGQPAEQWGIPAWRANVMYVAQSRVTFKLTPQALFDQIKQFGAQRDREHGDLTLLVQSVGLDASVLHQPWAELSGGQVQRTMLALAVALRPQFLLLDEPTSACDPASTLLVESMLQHSGCGLIWVTHDPRQAARVGGRVLEFPIGGGIAGSGGNALLTASSGDSDVEAPLLEVV